jgi:hypothetical protein
MQSSCQAICASGRLAPAGIRFVSATGWFLGALLFSHIHVAPRVALRAHTSGFDNFTETAWQAHAIQILTNLHTVIINFYLHGDRQTA